MRSSTILRRPDDDGIILIESRVLRIFDQHRQRSTTAPESGGILLGFRRQNHLHIADATSPNESDGQMRNFFSRSAHFHQSVARAKWKNSGGTIDYLGEWHTHPELGPTPSTIDKRGWLRISRFRKAPMVFIIVGERNNLWVGLGDGAGICRAFD